MTKAPTQADITDMAFTNVVYSIPGLPRPMWWCWFSINITVARAGGNVVNNVRDGLGFVGTNVVADVGTKIGNYKHPKVGTIDVGNVGNVGTNATNKGCFCHRPPKPGS